VQLKRIFTRMVLLVLLLVIGLNAGRPEPDYGRPALDYAPLQKQIGCFLAGKPGTYGVYFIDLNSGAQFGYNAYTAFHAASTFKLPMNLYLYRQAARGRLNLDEQLVYAPRHLEGGTGVLKSKPPGGSYPVAQLASYSIIYSDNVATNMLLERLGRKNVKSFMRSLGGLVVDDEQNVTCPHDLALYMRETLQFARSRHPEGKILLEDLFNAQFKERIPYPLPPGTRAANKIGTWPPSNTYNDVAYVVHLERPYILAVTSKDTPGYYEALEVIRQVSKMVYQFQSTGGSRPPAKAV